MPDACLWCGDEGCGVCDPVIAEANREKWRKDGTWKACRVCGEENDAVFLTDGVCVHCASQLPQGAAHAG